MAEVNEKTEECKEEVFPFIEGHSINLLLPNLEHVSIYIKWKEAGKLLVSYCFKELNLKKIFTAIFSPNIDSWRCVEKVGMTREATLKNHAYIDGAYVDDYKYCIFKEDWFKMKV